MGERLADLHSEGAGEQVPSDSQMPTEERQPPEQLWPLRMTANTRSVLLSALDEAAEHKRDAIETCEECRDGSCGSCVWRTEVAAEYARVAGVLAEARPQVLSLGKSARAALIKEPEAEP